MAEEKKVSKAPAKAVTAVKKDDTKPGFFKRVGKWFREMKSELKKVVWTSKTEVWKSFQLVIATVVAVSVAIAVIDYVSSLVINTIAGLIG